MIKSCVAVSVEMGEELFKKHGHKDDYIFISINGGAEKALPEQHNTLVLHFSDIEPKDIISSEYFIKAMSSDQANDIVDFILKYEEYNKEYNLIVHCYMGISRSGAVSKFIKDIFDIEDWHQKNSHIKPNQWILNLLHQSYLNKTFY